MQAVNPTLNFFRSVLSPFRLKTDDIDLLRAQFREFFRQIPLLYFILSANIAAVTVAAWHIDSPVLARVTPAALCLLCATRGFWWWRRKFTDFPDSEIARYMRNTSNLAGVLTATIVCWILLLYPLGTEDDRSRFVYFIALTEISCVFCLMPLRSAALSVSAIGILPTIIYFLVSETGRMWVQAVNLALVGIGMVLVLVRYNKSFAELIHSQRDLQVRQAETERLSEENRKTALTDALSGLPNRRALIAMLEDLHERSLTRVINVAVLFVDLDGFKQINDNFGHELGDMIIRQISLEFAALLPSDAVLFRLGGDEFSILLEAPDAAREALAISGRIQRLLSHPLKLAENEVQVGASIGIASSNGEEVDTYELLRRADTAMYRAKSEGGQDTVIYVPALDEGRAWRQRVESEIRLGIDRNEFDVYYQPLVDAVSGEINAVEALARWPGRAAGPLGPDEFIPVAETSGLIHQLGLLVLRQACAQLAPFPGIKLNVNVSPAQFRHPHFEQDVSCVLRETRFPPERLQIEITEGYLIDNPDRANRAIASFAKMGVRVALDDFGSGFASIGYLRNYPFSGIKIDRSLSSGLGKDPKASMLISGMVHLARGLDMSVTAEGVETENQATMLRSAGCHQLQGFYFGRPLPLHEIAGLLMKSAA